MFTTRLRRTAQPHEGGGGASPQANLRRPLPAGHRGTRWHQLQKPSLLAGFFVVPARAEAAPTNRGRERRQFLRVGLRLALACLAGLWFTACNSLPPSARPVSIQRPPGFAAPPAEAGGDVKLTLLTYNVWGLPSWLNHETTARYATIANDLERLHPDLVFLQEVWTQSAATVAPTNGDWLVARTPPANFFRRNGLVILSRLPICGAEFHSFRNSAFPDSVVRKGALKLTVLAPGGQRLNLWNVHLQSGAPRVRLHQIEQLIAWVREARDSQVADLVAGDFNSTPDSPEFRLLSQELGQTVHEVAHLPFLPTYDGLSRDPKKAHTIDYVFIRPRSPMDGLRAAPSLAFTNPNPRQRLSDHVALEVALRFHAESSLASHPPASEVVYTGAGP